MTTIIVTIGAVELGRVTLPRSADAVLDALVEHTVVLELDGHELARVIAKEIRK